MEPKDLCRKYGDKLVRRASRFVIDRLAKGNVSKEDYEAMVNACENSPHPSAVFQAALRKYRTK